MIEAIELSVIGFVLWSLIAIFSPNTPNSSIIDLIVFLLIIEGMLLGSWVIYNLYIRIARAGGRLVDVGLWIIASLATASYTFWAWSILDINRLIVSKLLYRGDAPVELAWSARSKQVRKAWEKARKEGYVLSIG
jgi:hypothetical protein